MKEYMTEQLVKKRTTLKDNAIKAGLIALTVLSFFLFFLDGTSEYLSSISSNHVLNSGVCEVLATFLSHSLSLFLAILYISFSNKKLNKSVIMYVI